MVEPHLETLIQNREQLMELLRLRKSYLSEAHRDQILTALKPQLETWIQNGKQLMELLNLDPNKELFYDQRIKILTALKPHLGTLITDVRQLKNLFDLDPEKLSDDQRTSILTELQKQQWWTQKERNSGSFFTLPLNKLSNFQRNLVLEAQNSKQPDETDKPQKKRRRTKEPAQLPPDPQNSVLQAQDSNFVPEQKLIAPVPDNILFLSKDDLLTILQDCQSTVDCAVIGNLRLLSGARQKSFSYKDIDRIIEQYWFIKDVPDTMLFLFGQALDDCKEASSYSKQQLSILKGVGGSESRKDLKKILNAISVKFPEKLSGNVHELTRTTLQAQDSNSILLGIPSACSFFDRDDGAKEQKKNSRRPRTDSSSGDEETKEPQEKHRRIEPITGTMTNQVGSNEVQGYLKHEVEANGDCGYTSFGISREDAQQLLLTNVADIFNIIKIPVKAALLIKDFYDYLVKEGAVTSSHDAVIELSENYSTNLLVQNAYIQYDVGDKCIDAGYSHPAVLQALAHIQKIEIHMWRLGEKGVLVPHNTLEGNYAVYTPQEPKERVDILFINNNHFERLDLIGYGSNIPENGIYPLETPLGLVDLPRFDQRAQLWSEPSHLEGWIQDREQGCPFLV